MNGNDASLDFFWKLSNVKENVRTDAAVKLLHSLIKNKKNDLESLQNEDPTTVPVAYTLERLIRGLASDRKTSIQGFFVSLVELLRQHVKVSKNVSVDQIFETVDKVLHIKGTQGEESSYMRGKMLCYGALIRSGAASTEELGLAVEKLVKLSGKRNFLAIPSYKIILESFSQVNDKEFAQFIWPKLMERLKAGLTMENLWLILEVHSRYPNFFTPAQTKLIFGRKHLFNDEFLSGAIDLFMGGAFPLHYLSKLPTLKKLATEVNQSGNVEKFWLKHVESKVSKTNVFKSSVATIMLNAILATINDSEVIPKLLTGNVAEILSDQLSKDVKNEMEIVSLAVFDKVIKFAEKNPAIIGPILKQVLTANITFDKTTGSTIVQRLTALADEATVKQVASLYLDASLGLSSNGVDQPTSKERSFAAHQLAKLVNHPKLIDEIAWKVTTVSQIFAITLLDVVKPVFGLKAVPAPFSRETRVDIKAAFFKSLDLKSRSLESLCDILVGVAENVNKFINPSKSAALLASIDAASIKSWKTMITTLEKMRSGPKRKEDVIFQMLFVQIGFQLFSDSVMAQEVLEELHVCLEKSKVKKKRNKSDEEPEWIEVVVDLLLSLLSQNKHVLRQVVGSVMIVLSPHINDAAIQTIMEAIHIPKETETNGINKEVDSDIDTDEEDEDENSNNMGEEEEAENSDEENEESDEDDEEEEGDGNEMESRDQPEVDEEFRNRVKTAMGKHAATHEDSDEDIDMDDLDDEDIAKIDDALSNIFRSMCKKKSSYVKKKERQDALAQMHFKIRALDILDIYLAHSPKLSHVMFLLQPLIAALEGVVKLQDHAPLQSRLMGTLKKVTSLKKLPLDQNLTNKTFTEILQSLFEWGNSGSTVFPILNHPLPLFGQCCSMVLRYAEKFEEANNLKLEAGNIYASALTDFFVKKNCPFPLSVFLTPITSGCKSVLNWSDILSKHGFAEETRHFRRTHALTLFTALLKSPSFKDESNKKFVKKVTKEMVEKISQELLDCSKASEVKPRYFCELLNFIYALHTSGASNLETLRDPLENARLVIPTNMYFIDSKKAFNKVAIHLGLEPVKSNDKKNLKKLSNGVNTIKKSQASDDSKGDKKKKSKKKKKHSHEALKKKKEKKIFELEGQFEGQEMPSFSGIALNANLNFEEIQQPNFEEAKSSKRKMKEKAPKEEKMKKKLKKG